MHHFLIAVLCLWTLAGCGGLHKKAENLMENSAYEEAVSVYEQILRKDPKDEKALIGLRQAREKVIDSKLIQVRLSRIAGNSQNSADMLAHLVSLENQWQYFPQGKVFFTQEEESGFAFEFVTQKISGALQAGLPLAAQVAVNKYGKIFGGDYQTKFQRIQENVKSAGRSKCQTLSAMTDRSKPYFGQFVGKFCSRFNQAAPSLSPEAKAKDLYSSFNATNQIDGVSPELFGQFASDLESGFKSSPWFHVNGHAGAIQVKLHGQYKKVKDKELIHQVHSYTVQVPYIAHEYVTKTRSVPYTANEYTCSYGKCGNSPVTRYRSESYQEEQSVTRYRQEIKYQPYDAWKYKQNLALVVEGSLDLGFQKAQLSVSEKSSAESISHDWEMPQIGLHRQTLDLPDPLRWVRTQSTALGKQLNAKLKDLWRAKYCDSGVSDQSMAASGDQVHRCVRLTGQDAPEFVSRWYENQFGVTAAEAQDVLGLNDY